MHKQCNINFMHLCVTKSECNAYPDKSMQLEYAYDKKNSQLTRSVWCSWANSAETRSFRDTTSRKFPHSAMSREHSCAKFMFTSSANSSGLSALCYKITYMHNHRYKSVYYTIMIHQPSNNHISRRYDLNLWIE